MLKRVHKSRHPYQTPVVVWTQSAMLLLKRTALLALPWRCLMSRIRLALLFFMVAHKAVCQTLSKAFLKSMKTWWRSCSCWRYFSHRMRRLKICSVVLLPALKPACSLAMVFSACGFNLFSMIFSMTLLGWLMRHVVVLAMLQVAFLWTCYDQGLGPRDWPFSGVLDLVADCRESCDYFSIYLHQFCRDVVNSS